MILKTKDEPHQDGDWEIHRDNRRIRSRYHQSISRLRSIIEEEDLNNNEVINIARQIGCQLRKFADMWHRERKIGKELGILGDHLMARYEGDDHKADQLHEELRRLQRRRSCG